MKTLFESVKAGAVFGVNQGIDASRDTGKLLRESNSQLRKKGRLNKATHKCLADLSESIAKGNLTFESFGGIRNLFVGTVENGEAIIREMENNLNWSGFLSRYGLQESNGTSAANFSAITNQLLSSEALSAWESPIYLADQLTTPVESNLKVERMARLASIGDDALTVGEFERYPAIQRSLEYVDLKEVIKRGFQHRVSREAVLFNRTDQAIADVQQGVEALRINKEKRVLNCVTGITNEWSPADTGKSTDTYQTGGGSDRFDNTVTSNPLDDHKALQAVKKKAAKMTDPVTGEPVVIGEGVVLSPEAIAIETDVWWNGSGVRETNGNNTIIADNYNPIKEKQLHNEYVSRQTGSDTTWFYGNPKKAFVYKRHWDFSQVDVPSNSASLAETDCVSMTVFSEYGDPFPVRPEYMFKCTA